MSAATESKPAMPDSSSSGMDEDLASTPAPRQWTRRLSQPLAPGLASTALHNLRGALLGYLGEVEATIRGRIAGDPLDGLMPGEAGDDSVSGNGERDGDGWETQEGSSFSHSEGDTSEPEHESEHDEGYGDKFGGRSTGLNAGAGGGDGQALRRRHAAGGTGRPQSRSRPPAAPRSRSGTATPTSSGNQEALLNHLSTLKDDVKAYLPALTSSFRLPVSASGPAAAFEGSQEWLRTLPGRLRQVERALPVGMGMGMPAGLSFPFGAYGQRPGHNQASASADVKPETETEPGALLSARQRVLDMVRSVLPSDEWEGWERLGWEETNGEAEMDELDRAMPRLTRSVSHPTHVQGRSLFAGDDEDDEDEEEGEDDEDDGENAVDGSAVDMDTAALVRPRGPPTSASRFFFPNRTPAATEAIARRRTMRSRSLGSAGYGHSGKWTGAMMEGEMQAAGRPLDRLDTALVDGGRAWLRASAKGDEGSEEGVHFTDDERAREGYFSSPLYTARPMGSAVDAEDDEVVDPTAPIVGGVADPTVKGKGKAKAKVTIDPASLLSPSISASPKAVKPSLLTRSSSVQPGYEWELGPSVMDALKLSADGKVLLDYEELPVHWRNNEHVLTGYRFIPLHADTGPIPLIKSAFAWHNETINIHSHFIPVIFITCVIPFIIYATPLPNAHTLDTAILVLYLIAAISCMFTSASWHVLSGCASKKWFEWGACVDYIGISWLIAASFGTVVYNAFYCRPNLVFLYLGTNAACGALGSYLPFQRWFNLRKMKPWRIGFFLFLNFAMFAPMLQLFWQHGWVAGSRFCAAFVPSILAYVAGLLFYAFHFPECVWPGRFDYVLASHQLWHAGIVIAVYLHYRAVFAAHDMRYDLSCAVPGAGMDVGRVVGGWAAGLVRGWW